MSSRALKILALAYGQYFNILVLFSKRKVAKQAFVLFSTPRKGRLLPHQSDYLNKFEKKIASVANTVLLCHGWESNAFRWKNLIEKLQEKGFTIISFDAPAHGASSGAHLHVPVYEACTTALIKKYKPAYVIGHSIGGLALLYSQHKEPQPFVKKVVSLGAPSELSEIMANYQEIVGFNNRVLKALDGYFKERFSFGIEDFSMSELAKNIDKEGLLIHDRGDTIAPYSAALSIQKNWKNSKLLTTEGLGHSLHQDHVNDHIISFLDA